ncbi:MAG: tetratricopeptide repeat protein [Labilithrix sp.]|nr:tetratricopeptide repeat protein [Labilithrix sp.]MCW5813971.1 tetratricopeptide repeat protein [Labilithrix sp.]
MPHHRPSSRSAALVAGVLALATLTGCGKLSARFRAREGVDLYHEGKYAQAADKFEEAVQKDPNLPVLLLNQGTSSLAYFRQVGGKTPEGQKAATQAIVAYQKYLEMVPKDDRVKGALIQTFVETARYDDAVAFFKPLTDQNPPDIEALITLATIASKTSKPEEAAKWFQKRVDATPNKPEGFLAYGIFLWQELHDHPEWPHETRLPKAELALELLKKAIDLQPNAPNGYSYSNLVYREIAATDPSEENKKKSLEEANRFYKLAAERQSKAG